MLKTREMLLLTVPVLLFWKYIAKMNKGSKNTYIFYTPIVIVIFCSYSNWKSWKKGALQTEKIVKKLFILHLFIITIIILNNISLITQHLHDLNLCYITSYNTLPNPAKLYFSSTYKASMCQSTDTKGGLLRVLLIISICFPVLENKSYIQL